MTCEEIFKRLYETLNAGAEKLTPEILDEHYRLCQSCCQFCKFDAEVIKAMQESCFKDQPSNDLRSRVLKDIERLAGSHPRTAHPGQAKHRDGAIND